MDMNLKASDMDQIFNGSQVILNSAKTVYDVFSGNPPQNDCYFDSRRNTGPPQGQVQQPPYSGGYTAPIQYGYGYADNSIGLGTGYYTNSLMRPNIPATTNGGYGGYPGISNPAYGGGIY